MKSVNIRPDRSEQVTYDYADYRAYIRRGFLSHYENYAAESHWHADLEFIYICKGEMSYQINGETVLLTTGNGILVNAEQLHFGFSEQKQECEFLCILLHPILLCASQDITHNFITPVLEHPRLPYLLLNQSIPWQNELLSAIQTIYAVRQDDYAPLKIQQSFLQIFLLLNQYIRTLPCAASQEKKQSHQHLTALKKMIAQIQNRYAEKLSLDEIASAGFVSKSTCLSLFKRYLSDTPTNFLIAYRLKQAASLLRQTELAITEIALAVGFQSASYFSETFRKIYGCTPCTYRNQRKKA